MDKFFRLTQNKTNVKTEIAAGITTFVTMAYIIFVNPSVLGAAGMDPGAVMVATCISAAIGTALMGLLSNYPLAQAPGMGLNAFFAVTMCGVMGFSWQAALAAVFISGILFILITVTGFRKALIEAIPLSIKKAIGGGIGLFIAYLGIKNAGLLKFIVDPWNILVTTESGTVIANSMAQPTISFAGSTAILSVIGLVIAAILVVKKVKGSLLYAIVGTSIVGAIMQFGLKMDVGIVIPTSFKVASVAPTFGKFIEGFGELASIASTGSIGLLSVFTVLISLVLVDMFDTVGTLLATTDKAGYLDENGNLPNANKALLADAIATSVGAVFGTSNVTTYLESASGVAAGGRTGLTSMVTAGLFLISIVASPILGLIPTGATAPILIVVGVMMMSALKKIDWDDLEEAIPAFMIVAVMPLMASIADGIAAGFAFYVVVKLALGKAKEIHPLMYVMCILFALRFFLLG